MDERRSAFKVQVLTAGGAVPLPFCNVRITGEEEENREIDRSLLTDESGICEVSDLPCPPKDRSVSPENSGERVYAKYRIRVFADGFEPKEVLDAALFETVRSLYICHLVPVGNYDRSPFPERENDITISKQNPNL